jgi:hypothetical protein
LLRDELPKRDSCLTAFPPDECALQWRRGRTTLTARRPGGRPTMWPKVHRSDRFGRFRSVLFGQMYCVRAVLAA